VKELLELRVLEQYADRFFGPDEGTSGRVGIARRVVIPSDDPRLPAMAAFQRELDAREDSRLFIGSWRFIRRYSAADLRAAELFHLHLTGTAYPAGEDCGTVYDPGSACPICGAGRTTRQLRLRLRQIPKHLDIAKSIAQDEWIVNERFAEMVARGGFTGLSFRPVENGVLRRSSKPAPVWYQLGFTGPTVSFSRLSRFGSTPVDVTNKYACPAGDTVGHALISRAHVKRPVGEPADFMRSTQYVGSAYLRFAPHPLLFVSPRVRAAIREHAIKGTKTEIAYYAAENGQ
jgi:hypothetical protein